ncbi:hypothetical protein [Caulobacter sp. BK020]|uniref:hypothetical protein n=1 Tax=Caulobacter sp. BK020 TaxID=2512117 RepID=UPI001043CF6E|nr:hypothetical protein [Caulobacter sp. BK020]TCS12314.1 hypothetical protein EV278_11493 [Caulobacter sp. BK020]
MKRDIELKATLIAFERPAWTQSGRRLDWKIEMIMKDAICLGCDVVRQIDVSMSVAGCDCGGKVLLLLNEDAFRIGRLAHRLGSGYYAHSAILDIVSKMDHSHPIDYTKSRDVIRKDGTRQTFLFDYYLRESFRNVQIKGDLDRVWLAGALIALGDALEKSKYFDRAPHLELVRHLRNGVSHGNKFRIDNPEKLKTYPANNFSAPVKSPTANRFEVTPSINGHNVMFDFMEPADFLDLFAAVEIHMFSIAIGVA